MGCRVGGCGIYPAAPPSYNPHRIEIARVRCYDIGIVDSATEVSPRIDFSDRQRELLAAADIDHRQTVELVHNLIRRRAADAEMAAAEGAARHTEARLDIAEIDNNQIIDGRGEIALRTNYRRAIVQLAKYITYDTLQSQIVPTVRAQTTDGTTRWSRELLTRVGTALYPLCGYGVLNGGSATGYVDPIHNRRFSAELFDRWRSRFEDARRRYGALPKALCPALYNGDGSAGPTFMELRAAHVARASAACGTSIPMFQMTNRSNNARIARATAAAFELYYRQCPPQTGDVERTAQAHYSRNGQPLCAQQPLLATFACEDERGLSLERMPPLFARAAAAVADTDGPLPYGLPGGHGQCLYVLRGVLETLLDSGVRFVFLGNIDNVGYTLNPIAIAYLVLRGGEALFEFIPRSAADVNGGILARDDEGRIRNAELGRDFSAQEMAQHQAQGKMALLNCAIGLFDLERLLLRLDEYMRALPVHCRRKKTSVGEYWQLEQITWDIIGLIEKPYILVGKKEQRFLATKLIAESFMVSGLPTAAQTPLAATADRLFEAMKAIAAREYGVKYRKKEAVWETESM